jgi:hypothetical protein
MDSNPSDVQRRRTGRLPGEFLASVVENPLPILFAISPHNGFSQRAYLPPSEHSAS